MGDHRRLSANARLRVPLAVRTAGLPARIPAALRFDKSFAVAEELLWLRENVEATANDLADALYPVIGALGPGSTKSAIVGLRRALHTARCPRRTEWNGQVARELPAPLAERIRAWTLSREALERRRVDLAETLTTERIVKRAQLRAVAEAAAFRRALSQASPTLFTELSKWLADERCVPRHRSLAGLAKYVVRAATKTSPYSTFMVSGPARWAETGPAVRDLGVPGVRGVLELEGTALHRLIRTVGMAPGAAGRRRVRLNPSARIQSAAKGDDEASNEIGGAQGTVSFAGRPPREPIVTMPATPAIHACMEILGARELAHEELRDALAAAGDAPSDRVETFLNGLLDAGLLQDVAPVTELSPDPLGELRARLGTHAEQASANANWDSVAELERLRTELRREVPIEDVEGHVTRQRALVGAATELARRLPDLPRPDDQSARWLFHENAVFTSPAVECSAACWRPVIDDLDVLRRWLAPFDPGLPLRLALGPYVRARFGAGAVVSVLTLHRAVQQDLEGDTDDVADDVQRALRADPDGMPPLAEAGSARLRELDRIRRRAVEAVLRAGVEHDVIRVDPAALAESASAWPDWVEATGSLGWYVQILGPQQPLSVAVNAAHCGFGRGHGRLRHLVERAGGDPGPDVPPGAAPRGPVPVEIGGLFGWSANARSASTSYELDYPFTTSGRPPGQRIRAGSCMAVHDPTTDLVGLRAEGVDAPILPVHLGMMADVLLPPLAKWLVNAFGHGYYFYPSSVLADPDLCPPAGADAVVRRPRVEVGTVVLRRASWAVPVGYVPCAEPGESDADYWLRLLAWLRGRHIPTQCFVRVRPAEHGSDPDTESMTRWLLDKAHKPVYVDFANWYLVMGFQRMLDDDGATVVLEEVLPKPEDAPQPANDPVVTEFLIEISDPEVP